MGDRTHLFDDVEVTKEEDMPAAALRRGRLCWAEGAKVLDGNGWLAEELRDCFGSVHADGAAAAAAALLTVVVVVVVVGEGDAAAAHWWVGGGCEMCTV